MVEASVALPEHSKLPRNANQREVMRYAEAYALAASPALVAEVGGLVVDMKHRLVMLVEQVRCGASPSQERQMERDIATLIDALAALSNTTVAIAGEGS